MVGRTLAEAAAFSMALVVCVNPNEIEGRIVAVGRSLAVCVCLRNKNVLKHVK